MTQRAGLLPRYQQLRKAGFQLTQRMVETVSSEALNEAGARLGILKGNVLVLDSKQEMVILIDYSLHDVRHDGVNAVERFLATSPPVPDSDEWIYLQALQHAWYSLFAVDSIEPGVGVEARDLLRDESLFIADVALSQTVVVGSVLSARILAPEGIHVSTGAILPVGLLTPRLQDMLQDKLKTALKNFTDFRHLSAEQASDLATRLIRTLLKTRAARRIEYLEPGEQPRSGRKAPASFQGEPVRRPEALPAAQRVGRNDPCSCGSGKKFKRCCGQR